MAEESSKRKFGQVTGQPGQPLQFTEEVDLAGAAEPSRLCGSVGLTIRAYYKVARELLEAKYASAKAVAPPHLRSACDIFVLECQDGVIVRYDMAAEEAPK